jgi:lysozyme
MATDQLRDSIIAHEGSVRNAAGEHVAYRDHLGHLTIGYGTLLDDRLTISEEIAAELLTAELKEKEERLLYVDGWANAGPVRRAVLLEMAYWLGVGGCLRFKRMWGAVRGKDWPGAAAEMRDSRVFRDPQTRGRMDTLAKRMESGSWTGGAADA